MQFVRTATNPFVVPPSPPLPAASQWQPISLLRHRIDGYIIYQLGHYGKEELDSTLTREILFLTKHSSRIQPVAWPDNDRGSCKALLQKWCLVVERRRYPVIY